MNIVTLYGLFTITSSQRHRTEASTSEPECEVSTSDHCSDPRRAGCLLSFLAERHQGYCLLLGAVRPKFLTREPSPPASKQWHTQPISCFESLTSSLSIDRRGAPAFRSLLWLSRAHKPSLLNRYMSK